MYDVKERSIDITYCQIISNSDYVEFYGKEMWWYVGEVDYFRYELKRMMCGSTIIFEISEIEFS